SATSRRAASAVAVDAGRRRHGTVGSLQLVDPHCRSVHHPWYYAVQRRTPRAVELGSADVQLVKLAPRRRRALRSARVLDEVVNDQVALLPQLPEEVRLRYAEHLAELVML